MKPAEEFRKHKKQVKIINNLVQEWIKKQSELEMSGLEKKEILGITTDKRRMKDLQKLKIMGGPFIHPQEVDDFINDDTISSEDKDARLYIEVRYARDTTLSLPRSSALFRLREI